jgi:hypothetical protein
MLAKGDESSTEITLDKQFTKICPMPQIDLQQFAAPIFENKVYMLKWVAFNCHNDLAFLLRLWH